MKICEAHWATLRQGIEDRGMAHLIGTGESAMEAIIEELEGSDVDESKFDPLLQANNYIWSRALETMGLSVMVVDETPGAPNEGHVCPLCMARKTFDRHNTPTGRCGEDGCNIVLKPGEKPWDEFVMNDQCLDPMRQYCLQQGLVAQPS